MQHFVINLPLSLYPLHKWHLNLNTNTWFILSLITVSRQRNFHMNVRLRLYEYCCSNLGPFMQRSMLTDNYVHMFTNSQETTAKQQSV